MKINYTNEEVQTIKRFLHARLSSDCNPDSKPFVYRHQYELCKCCDALTIIDETKMPRTLRPASLQDRIVVGLLRTLKDVATEEEDCDR